MAKTLVTDTDISLSSLHQQLLIKPAASNDSTTVVQIQNSAGTVVLNVDTTNNRVGIGTNSPTHALQVVGQINISDSNSYIWGAGTSYISGSSVSNFITFNTALTERMRITSAGNVGIGTTSPLAPLHTSLVSSATINEIGAIFERTGGPASGIARGIGIVFKDQLNTTLVAGVSGIRIGPGNDWGGGLGFFTNAASSASSATFANLTERMRIDAAGNVGIGTTTPVSKLDITDTSNANLPIVSIRNTNGYSPQLNFDTYGYLGSPAAMYSVLNIIANYAGSGGGYVQFNTKLQPQSTAVTAMTILGGGNVGIGTASPAYALDVTGTIRSSAGILNTTNTFEKVFSSVVNFPHTVANQAVDIRLGNLAIGGYIEVELNSTYSNQASYGKLTKLFAIGTNPNNAIYTNESRVSDALGTLPDNVAIGDISWDATNSVYRIPISHIVSTGNQYTIKVRMFSDNGLAKPVFDAMTVSSIYTLTALSRNYVNYNGNVGIGTTAPSAKLDVTGTSSATPSNLLNLTQDYTGGAGGATFNGIVENFTGTLPNVGVKFIDMQNAGVTKFSFGGNSGNTNMFFKRYGTTAGYTFITGGANLDNLQIYGTNSSNPFTIEPAGNVGIGTTAPTAKLHVYGGNLKQDDGTYNLLISSGSTITGSNHIIVDAAASYLQLKSTSNSIFFTQNSVNSFYSDSVGAVVNTLYLKQGNVGIRTATPIVSLDVLSPTATATVAILKRGLQPGNDTALPTTFGNPYLQLGGGEWKTGHLISIGFQTSGSQTAKPSAEIGAVNVYNSANTYSALVFGTRSVTTDTTVSERMRIDQNGNVGIGTTSPSTFLHVSDPTTSPAIIARFQNTGAGGGPILQLDRPAVERVTALQYSTAGVAEWSVGIFRDGGNPIKKYAINLGNDYLLGTASKLVIDIAGNVGIGTTSPAYLLDVYATSSVIAARSTGSTGSYATLTTEGLSGNSGNRLLFRRGQATGTIQDRWQFLALGSENATDNGAGTDLSIQSQVNNGGWADRLFINRNSGNVGIGTTTPAQKLEVAGIGRFTGTGGFSVGDEAGAVRITSNNASTQLFGLFNSTNNYTGLRLGSLSVGQNYAASNSPASGMIVQGNVGIGTTSPSKLLHVAGDALINTMTVGLGAGSIATNTAVGFESLALNTTGYYNTALGYRSSVANTTGPGNTALGAYTLYANTTGSNTTAVGYGALTEQSTATYNTSVGYLSSSRTTTGDANTALGAFALYFNTTGGGSTAVGYQAMSATTTGVATFGTVVGGSAYTNGTYTAVQLTYSSGTTAATYPTATIVVAGGVVTSVTLVTAGTQFKNTTTVMTATAASIGGTGSGFTVAVATLTAGNGTAVGYFALYNNTTGGYNTALGAYTLNANTTGSYNTAMGVNSLLNVTAGSRNVAIGYATLQASTSSDNVAVGYAALPSNTSGSNNTALGFQSQYTATTASYNTSVGYGSLQTNTGGNNTAVGDRSLYNQGLAGSNTAFGQFSGYTNSTGSFNTFIGTQASYYNTTGANNTSVGYNALQRNSTGGSNTAVGYQAGYYYNGVTGNNLTPSNSVYIGNNTSALADGQTNQIVIGDSAIGAGSNTATLGNTAIVTTILRGNVGIGTTSPTASLQIGAAVGYNRTSPAIAVPVGLSGFKELIEFGSDSRGGGLTGYQDGSGLVRVSLGTRTSSTVSEQFSVLNSGNVGIGTTAPNVKLDVLSGTVNTAADSLTASTMTVTGPNVVFGAGANNAGVLNVETNTALGIDVGGSIGFGGRYTGTAQAQWALIKGAKENATAGDYASYLAFGTRIFGGQVTERVRINSTGNVGIGITTPGYKLEVVGTANTEIARVGDGTRSFGISTYTPSSGGVTFRNNGTGLISLTAANAVLIGTSYAGLGTGVSANTVAIEGNVGIGTTSPGEKLHVSGGNILLDNTYSLKFKNSAGTAVNILNVSSADNVTLSTPSGGDLYLNQSSYLVVKSNGSVGIGAVTPLNKLTVVGSMSVGSATYNTAAPTNGMIIEGNVGIGITTPGYKLEVIGSANSEIARVGDGTRSFGISTYTPNSGGVTLRNSGTGLISLTAANAVLIGTGYAGLGTGVSANTVAIEGNVGIGTTTPGNKLAIVGSGAVIRITGTNDTSAVFTQFNSSTNIGLGYVGVEGSTAGATLANTLAYATFLAAGSTSSALQLGTPGGIRATILANGNVGIGTTSPSKLLHVAGDALINGITVGLGTSSIAGNTAVGQQTLLTITSGAGNTAIGYVSGSAITTGANNTTLGYNSGASISTGGNNIAIGQNAGTNQATGTYNVYIGAGSYASAAGVSNEIVIGAVGGKGANTAYIAGSTVYLEGSLALKSPTTVNAATYTMASTDSSLIITTTNCTITLLSAATYTGRILYIKNITAHSLTSNASNVVPLGSATAGTAILAATAGKFAMLQSDGTNWITMMSN